MSETKHTPGPWCVRHFAGDHGRATVEQDRGKDNTSPFHPVCNVSRVGSRNVCEIYSLGPQGATSEAEANARLIAAAPSLLEACKVHGMRGSQYGSFADGLRNLANLLDEDPRTSQKFFPWTQWLVFKAIDIEHAVAKAEEKT